MQINQKVRILAAKYNLDSSQALAYASSLPKLSSFVPGRMLPHVGWYAIPSEASLARANFPDINNPDQVHCTSLGHIHAWLGDIRMWYDPSRITPTCLSRTDRTREFLTSLSQQQPGDIIIVAAQLGQAHRGESVEGVNYVDNECGLDSVAFGAILSCACPNLQPCFGMDCGGDRFAPEGRVGSPFYRYRGGRIEFGASPNDCCDPDSGVATIFVH